VQGRDLVLVVLDRHQRRAGTSLFFFLFLFVSAFLILWVSTSLCRWQADHRHAQLRQWDFDFTSSAVWNVACEGSLSSWGAGDVACAYPPIRRVPFAIPPDQVLRIWSGIAKHQTHSKTPRTSITFLNLCLLPQGAYFLPYK
jgi:hypothetical protein